MSNIMWENYGNSIADNEFSSINGRVRDIDAIILELKEIRKNMNTMAMSDYSINLQGQSKMLDSVIEYLERV